MDKSSTNYTIFRKGYKKYFIDSETKNYFINLKTNLKYTYS